MTSRSSYRRRKKNQQKIVYKIIFAIVFFSFLIPAVIIFTVYDTDNDTDDDKDINLKPGETILMKTNDYQQMSISGGYFDDISALKTYFFNKAPEKTGEFINISLSANSGIYMYDYKSWAIFVAEDESIDFNFQVEEDNILDFYIIKGSEEFKNFENDFYYDSEEHLQENAIDSTFTSKEGNIYYFVLYSQVSGRIMFEFNLNGIHPTYDISGSEKETSGEFENAYMGQFEYIVIKNTGKFDTIEFSYEFSDQILSTTAIILIIVAGIVILIVGIKVQHKKKYSHSSNSFMNNLKKAIEDKKELKRDKKILRKKTQEVILRKKAREEMLRKNKEQVEMLRKEKEQKENERKEKEKKEKERKETEKGENARKKKEQEETSSRTSKPQQIPTTILCIECGSEFDEPTNKRLVKKGFVFCQFCGKFNTSKENSKQYKQLPDYCLDCGGVFDSKTLKKYRETGFVFCPLCGKRY